MKYKLFILPFLLLISHVVDAAELRFENFSFNFAGNWEVHSTESGSTAAVYKGSDKKREFILTIMQPSNQEEAVKYLKDIQDYITNLDQVNSDYKVETKYTEYKTKYGAPFMYITYADNNTKGFFIGASLGSNAGILMITFEGSGSPKTGVEEFKEILESMSIKDK